MSDYRIVQYYHIFFAHMAYRLEKRNINWRGKERWEKIGNDSLGINPYKWQKHYKCPIIYLDGKISEVND